MSLALDAPPTFWAATLDSDAYATQHLPRGSVLVLTSASTTGESASLWVSSGSDSGGSGFLLGTLSADGVSHMELQQPFAGDVTFFRRGAGAIQLVGHLRVL